MSWSIQFEGTIAAVTEAVTAMPVPLHFHSTAGAIVQKQLDPDDAPPPSTQPEPVGIEVETKTFEMARAHILQFIGLLPEQVNGVRVRAAGQHEVIVVFEVEGKHLTL